MDRQLNIYAMSSLFFLSTLHAVSNNHATHDSSQTIHNDKVKLRRRSQFPHNATIMQRMFIMGMSNTNVIYILQSLQALLKPNRMKSWHKKGFPLSVFN